MGANARNMYSWETSINYISCIKLVSFNNCLESVFQNGFKNLVFFYFAMNALISTVSFQLIAGILSVWGGMHQTRYVLVSSEGFWLYIALRITGIQDLAHRIVYVLEHRLFGNGSFGLSDEHMGIFGGRSENKYTMHICVNPHFQVLFRTVAAKRQAFIISLDEPSYVLFLCVLVRASSW
jgi:hypothetical protein